MQIPTRTNGARWGVIFDVDGTMVDNAAFHEKAWIELGRRYGLPITREYYRTHIHARSNDRNVQGLLGGKATPEQIRRLSDEKEAIYRDSFRPMIREIPGLTAVLRALHAAGIPCAAASNSPRENVDMVLDELGIRQYFDVAVDRDQISHGKPDPEILLTAADKAGLPPERCIVVEDSSSGFKAAENAGMKYIVITAGADPEELKHAVRASAVYRDYTELSVADLAALLD
ncbi:MAG TPA: HAD family phosphatase [Anaerohalosphaeraceae bacterium]|jgi:beta-phosphoglucomutase|nr:HAD family phosphatase [Anaerohalosphaeraceae bacterium]HRT50498.1 HAD family phosphatase [Anaerohalosphaeraceae bacterium]HRT86428.1 HAD family phosphatase [Anaerohalosphaeraceae bacterium]